MSVRFDDETRRLLDEIAPPLDRPADWDDVLARAGAPAVARPRRRSLRPLALAAAVVAGALVAALILTRGGSPSLTDRALAAIGGGPMTHVVVEQGLTDRLVDLRTGTQAAAPLRIEFWSEPRHGVVYKRTSLGKTQTIFLSPSQQPTSALTSFYLDYRAKLRSGEVHELGKGRVDGQAVYWLELPGDTAGATVRVAVSQQTFKPVHTELWQDGRHVLAEDTRILTVESLPLDAALFRRASAKQSPLIGVIPYSNPRITLAQAAARMKRAPVVPAARIAGLRRVWIGPPRWQVGSAMQSLVPPPGVRLFYGTVEEYASSNDFGTRPDLNAAHVDVTEYAHYNPVLARPYGGAGSFPGGGTALLRRDVVGGDSLLTLRYRGLWITVEASSPRLALTAGRALLGAP